MEKKYFVFAFLVPFILCVTKINGIKNPFSLGGCSSSRQNSKTNRLLPTAENGCGNTKVKNTRIVGGSEAPVGKKNFTFRTFQAKYLFSEEN